MFYATPEASSVEQTITNVEDCEDFCPPQYTVSKQSSMHASQGMRMLDCFAVARVCVCVDARGGAKPKQRGYVFVSVFIFVSVRAGVCACARACVRVCVCVCVSGSK